MVAGMAALDQLKTFSVVDVSVGFMLKPAVRIEPSAKAGEIALERLCRLSALLELPISPRSRARATRVDLIQIDAYPAPRT